MGHAGLVAESRWQIVSRVAGALGILAICFYDPRPESVLVGWAAGLAFAFLMPSARRYLSRPSFRLRLDIYRSSFFLLVVNAATVIYFRSDIVVLQMLRNDAIETGRYAALERLLEGGIFLATPIAMAIFRSLRTRWQDHDAFREILTRQLLVLVV